MVDLSGEVQIVWVAVWMISTVIIMKAQFGMMGVALLKIIYVVMENLVVTAMEYVMVLQLMIALEYAMDIQLLISVVNVEEMAQRRDITAMEPLCCWKKHCCLINTVL